MTPTDFEQTAIFGAAEFFKRNVKELNKDAVLHILLRQKTGKLGKVLPLIVQQLFDSLSPNASKAFQLGNCNPCLVMVLAVRGSERDKPRQQGFIEESFINFSRTNRFNLQTPGVDNMTAWWHITSDH